MTELRRAPYVWVTWLSKLMAGETECDWAPWFRTNHVKFAKEPSGFELAVWTADHTRLLSRLIDERQSLGEGVFKENQNMFRVRRPSGLTIAGKPDLVTMTEEGVATVFDAKTGNPRQSDIIQVMLYMMCLPYAAVVYRGKWLRGCVVYKSGHVSNIPPTAVTPEFQGTVTHFLDRLESVEPPRRSPSPYECRFCDITSEDCADRIPWVEPAEGEEDEPPEIAV